MIACQVFQIGGIMAGFILWFCTQLVSCILVKLNLEVRTITDIPSPKLTFLYIAEINSKIMITVIAVNSLICLMWPLEQKQCNTSVMEFFRFLISHILLILFFCRRALPSFLLRLSVQLLQWVLINFRCCKVTYFCCGCPETKCRGIWTVLTRSFSLFFFFF